MSSLRFVLVEYVSQLFHTFDASKNQALPILFKLPAIPSDSFHVRLSFLLTYQEKTPSNLSSISHFFHTKKPAVALNLTLCPKRGAASMDAGGQRRHQNLATDLWRAAQRPAYVGAMGMWRGGSTMVLSSGNLLHSY